MNPIRAILSAFRNYANFEGRASRSEYWWFYGFFVVLLVGLFVASLVWSPTLLSVWVAYLVLMAPPLCSVTVRRLHDTDRSGRLAFLGFLPFAGGPRLTRLLTKPGTVGPNRYGPDPWGPATEGWVQHPVIPEETEPESRQIPEPPPPGPTACPRCRWEWPRDALFCGNCGLNFASVDT